MSRKFLVSGAGTGRELFPRVWPSVALCSALFSRGLDGRHRTGHTGTMGPTETERRAACGKGPAESVRAHRAKRASPEKGLKIPREKRHR